MAAACETCSPPLGPSPKRIARSSNTPGSLPNPALKVYIFKNGTTGPLDPFKGRRILVPHSMGKVTRCIINWVT